MIIYWCERCGEEWSEDEELCPHCGSDEIAEEERVNSGWHRTTLALAFQRIEPLDKEA